MTDPDDADGPDDPLDPDDADGPDDPLDPDDADGPDDPLDPDDADGPDDPLDPDDADGPDDPLDPDDSFGRPADAADAGADVDDLPTVTCERCDEEWELAFELEELQVGNQAVEQFALDHRRHTGHFPDGVATWRAACRRCPEGAERLAERAARRWAETHARHTSHAVDLHHDDGETTTRVEP